MTDITNNNNSNHEKLWNLLEREQVINKENMEKAFAHHLEYTMGRHRFNTTKDDIYQTLCFTVRDMMIDRLNETQYNYRVKNPKRVYYLSLEFLIGRTLENSLINLGIYHLVKELLEGFGYSLDDIIQYEPDAGLGNGGLGRLAACFMDSLSTLDLPGYGYGLRYEYGIFNQNIENGVQMEKPDHWLVKGNPWEILRQDTFFPIFFYGHVDNEVDPTGRILPRWHPTETVLAVAYDYPVPGYNTRTVNNLRLWAAKSSEEFNFDYFNHGDYMKAVEDKQKSENISKVLYPNDTTEQGKILRLKQQYLMVAASLMDIIKRYKRDQVDFDKFSEQVSIQLNDTHPSMAIVELMRIFLDIEKMEWDEAWNIIKQVFAYTNHTVLPEALETWKVALIEFLLPRHMQIIYEINHRFLEEARASGKVDEHDLSNMSIIQEGSEKRIRMANLSVIGSHSINGVAALHSELLKTLVFPSFYKLYPEKFSNKTNGVSQRRFLLKANPKLSNLIYTKIGDHFITDLYNLKSLESFADDPGFQEDWRKVKLANKENLARIIRDLTGVVVDTNSLFDVQVKRIHEYKRQLLNILNVIAMYIHIHERPHHDFTPRTFIFGGKAAPGYFMAKLIIRFINAVASIVNNDKVMGDRLKVVFLPNFRVSLAEEIYPGSDLSEQISTAGTEASGTGNMKFAMNGALTIGTLDGANVEIMEEVGEENIFIFGLRTPEVLELKKHGYNPEDYLHKSEELKRVFTLIHENFFSKDQIDLFKPIHDSLLYQDVYCILPDFPLYADCQRKVSEEYKNKSLWTKKSILNVARIGKFSSDRTIQQYAEEIWKIKKVEIKHPDFKFYMR